jgi:iron complex transport system ATP-binding protein
LAARVSDKILCVNGEYVDRFGKSEEIFVTGYISNLFQISSGSFDEENGSMELETTKGPAEVFVIAGGGSGRNVYRKLQRQGIAFTTGILFQNDLDYPVARALAVEVIESESFEPITDALLERAKQKINSCNKVISCKETFGSLEVANKKLFEYARKSNKIVAE